MGTSRVAETLTNSRVPHFRLIPAITAVVIMAGCSSGPIAPPLGMVKGKVTLDGKPIEGLVVLFMPENGRSSSGMTDKEGNYSLEFDQQHPGAASGQHKVRMMQN